MNRIAKEIARRGYCSRREAEKLIFDGKVIVDGICVQDPATKVSENAGITISGRKLAPADETKIWVFHKPKGCLTTRTDPDGRTTIFDILPNNLPQHLIPVGRLDYNSEGLLLLTNDGELAKKLMHPSSKIPRTYEVRVFGSLRENQIEQMRRGLTVDGVKYQPVKVKVLRQTTNNIHLEMTLYEGKNREIRRMIDHFGTKVGRLKRISYGPYELGDMKVGIVQTAPVKIKLD